MRDAGRRRAGDQQPADRMTTVRVVEPYQVALPGHGVPARLDGRGARRGGE